MATVVDRDIQDHAAAGPSFLSLPPEVRNMIYRLLLVADKPLGMKNEKAEREFLKPSGPVWASFGEYCLHPAILRVCWQLHREASPILNGENTYGICINALSHFHGLGTLARYSNFQFDDVLGSFRKYYASIDKFQRFEIVIASAYCSSISLRVRILCCSVLSRLPALQHVRIHRLHHPFRTDDTILGPFGMLRNLRSVSIHGVQLPYAERLRGLMLGNTPQPNVKGMYCSLEKCVRDLNGDPSDLDKAMKALQEWDIEKFKEIRSKILSACQRRKDHALLHVFDFDAKSKEDRQAMIDESYERRSKENAMKVLARGYKRHFEDD